MYNRSEKESDVRVEGVETSVEGDLRQTDSSKSENEGLHDGSETSYEVQFGDTCTDITTGGWVVGGRVEVCNAQMVWTCAEDR